MKPDLIRCETELVIYEFRTLSGGKSAKDVTQLFNVICTWASANSLKVYKYNQNQTNSTHSYSESCTVHYLKCNTSLPTTPNSLYLSKPPIQDEGKDEEPIHYNHPIKPNLYIYQLILSRQTLL